MEAETVEDHYLLLCSFCLPQLAFLYNSGPPGQGWYHHSGLGLFTTIIIKKIMDGLVCRLVKKASFMEAFAQLRVTLPK